MSYEYKVYRPASFQADLLASSLEQNDHPSTTLVLLASLRPSIRRVLDTGNVQFYFRDSSVLEVEVNTGK